MKTYTVQLVDRLTENALGRVVIQAVDWRAAERIADAVFSNGYIQAWIEEDE